MVSFKKYIFYNLVFWSEKHIYLLIYIFSIMQNYSSQNPNKVPSILLWIGFGCYVLTSFLPIVTLTFIFSFDIMIYDALSELGLVLFFGGLISALVGAVSKNNLIIFRVCSILGALLAILPILAILLSIDHVILSMSVGFYTYVIGAILCLVAGIIYKSPRQLQRRFVPQGQIHQPSPIELQMYPQSSNQPLQSLQHQENVQIIPDEIFFFCSECGEKTRTTENFCKNCGSKIEK